MAGHSTTGGGGGGHCALAIKLSGGHSDLLDSELHLGRVGMVGTYHNS